MKKLALVLMILVLALLAGTAGAAEMINPDRQAAEEAGEFARKLYEQRTGGSGAVKSNDYAAGLRVTCNRNPSLNGTGSWSIALVGHRASEVTRMVCYLSHIDWCEDYSHTHWVDKSRKKGDTNPFMGTYTTPKILTSGKYQLTVHNRTSLCASSSRRRLADTLHDSSRVARIRGHDDSRPFWRGHLCRGAR